MRRTDLLDTSDEAHRLSVELARKRTPEQRLAQTLEMIETGKRLRAAGEQALIVRDHRK